MFGEFKEELLEKEKLQSFVWTVSVENSKVSWIPQFHVM